MPTRSLPVQGAFHVSYRLLGYGNLEVGLRVIEGALPGSLLTCAEL